MERPRRDTRKQLATAALPDVSAAEYVLVLVRLGWVPLQWDERECAFERGTIRIRVPLDHRLKGAELASLLDDAGVPVLGFLDALERIRARSMSATPTTCASTGPPDCARRTVVRGKNATRVAF